jgi:hypothetical protein
MTLNKTTLQNALYNSLRSYPSASQAAADWTNAYYNYASGATDPQHAFPQGLSTKTGSLYTSLYNIFNNLTTDVATVAGNMANAFKDFWQSIQFLGAGCASVVISSDYSALSSNLYSVFTSLSGDFQSKAQDIADKLHDFTCSVYVQGTDAQGRPYFGNIS